MDNDRINDLITRLRNSATPMHLREEVIATIKGLRTALEEVHISAKQNRDRSAEHISGIALGKPGYRAGDMAV